MNSFKLFTTTTEIFEYKHKTAEIKIEAFGNEYLQYKSKEMCIRDSCMDALASAIRDYEDAVVDKVASRKDMDYIVTRNIKDYQADVYKRQIPICFETLFYMLSGMVDTLMLLSLIHI